MIGLHSSVFSNEKFMLRIEFPEEYPSCPPRVYFLPPAPRHVHIYSNGDICLNILGRDWSPSISTQSLVISIISMLSSAKEKKSPADNLHHDSDPGGQQGGWVYHDDKC